MRIIFAGTPSFAAAHLEALPGKYSVVAVYTQPDRRAGRGKKLLPSPVKQLALDYGISVEQPLSLKEPQEQEKLANYNADIMVVAAYGMLLPEAVLDIPRYGCINVHASLLPRWRGAAPVERAIMAGDTETGVTIMQMDAGLDTGAMLHKSTCAISETETGDSLRDKLIEIGRPALIETLDNLAQRQQKAQQQDDSQANYAKKLDKSEACIDWRQPAVEIERKVRAFTSALACFSMLDGQRIRIVSCKAWTGDTPAQSPGTIELLSSFRELDLPAACLKISCGQGYLVVDALQLPGSKAMALAALLNGKPDSFATGMCFDAEAPATSTASGRQ